MVDFRDLNKAELCEMEEHLVQKLKNLRLPSTDDEYRFVKQQLWAVRDLLCDKSEVAAQTY